MMYNYGVIVLAFVFHFSSLFALLYFGKSVIILIVLILGLKEGYIDYKGHNVLGMTTRWIQGYFILT